MGYITLQGPGDYSPRVRSLDHAGFFLKLFPSASKRGVSFADLPPSARVIAKLFQGPRASIVSELVSRHGIKARINYELNATEFNQAYWLRNFIKCLAISRFARNAIQAQPRFIDIGGGAGPFALAISDLKANVNVTILDSSSAQERLFEELRQHDAIPQNIKFLNQRVNLEFLASNRTPRLFSYFLCENQELLSTQPKVLSVIGDIAVVVDYWHVIEGISEAALTEGMHAKIMSQIDIPLDTRLAQSIGQDRITVSGGIFKR